MTIATTTAAPNGTESLVGWLLGQSSVIITAGLLLAALWWVWRATGSTHVIRTRLWRFVFGKRDLGTDSVDDYLKERDQLMHFRTVTRLKRVGTRRAAERVVMWLRKNDVDSDLAASVGFYFEVDPPGLQDKIPGVGVQAGLACLSAALIVAGVVAMTLAARTPPVVRVNKTGNWYAVSKENTYAFQFPGPRPRGFAFEQCSAPQTVATSTNYPPYDVDVLCEAIKSEAPALHASLVGQLILGAAALVWCWLFGQLLWLSQSRIGAAHRLKKLLERRRKEGPRP